MVIRSSRAALKWQHFMDLLFFIASKLVGAALKVETWLLLVAVLTFWSVWHGQVRLAKRFSALFLCLFLAIGSFPLGDVLLRPIEHLVLPPEDLGAVDGIVVLGGGEDVPASLASGQPQMGEGGDRYIAALALAHQFPTAKLLFVGGSGRLRDATDVPVSEAMIARQVFLQTGVAPARLLFESRSRNTAENARLSRELVSPDPEKTWVLVTSAFHMPRALQSFKASGWEEIVPYPVDYRTRSWRDGLGWNFSHNLVILNTTIKEWTGRIGYTLTGR